ncbi:acyl carrier protein [Kitasatospora sp. NBC_01266]|jgi:polyketide synthase PksN|uniref:acyl carrier protein n=1 Tax=Kitasatospora sp. NBC_01266 TaxID=2903572 RepID=UPI002E355410|nr:acyl carrier protein [Kitasatospora sp. NBC_01266]
MTSEPLTSPPTAPFGTGADVLTGLTQVLADLLQTDPARIDPQQPFQALGLDSLLTAEFVAGVNASLGTRLAAGVLYDHPTPAALARQLAAEGAAAGSRPDRRDRTEQATTAGTLVLETLCEQVALLLHCDPWEIDPETPLSQLGIDSIVGAEVVAVINRTYGLAERPATLYDHPTLAAMATYLASRVGAPQQPAPPAPRRQDPAPLAVPRAAAAPLSGGELNALLDAVRDDLLTVDEAAALLAARAA